MSVTLTRLSSTITFVGQRLSQSPGGLYHSCGFLRESLCLSFFPLYSAINAGISLLPLSVQILSSLHSLVTVLVCLENSISDALTEQFLATFNTIRISLNIMHASEASSLILNTCQLILFSL